MVYKGIRMWMAVAIILVFASCAVEQKIPGPKLEQTIIGRWRQIDGQATMEFFREGAVIMVGSAGAMSAYYEFLDEHSVKIEPKFTTRAPRSNSRVWRLAVKGDELTVVEGKTATRFQRER
jgi:hypothetical protein